MLIFVFLSSYKSKYENASLFSVVLVENYLQNVSLMKNSKNVMSGY